MNIDSLKYFIEVSKTGSFSKASQALFITQQGLNKSMKALEAEFDIKLFKRSRQGATLTPDGETFRIYAEQILASYDNLLDALFDSKFDKTTGESPIYLGVSYYAAQIASSNPDYVRLLSNSSYIEMPFEQLIERASTTDGSDLIFLDLHGSSIKKLRNHPDLVFEPYIATQCGVVFKKSSDLAGCSSVHPSEICGRPIALNGFRDIAKLTADIFAEHHLEDVRLSVASPRMLLESVRMRPDLIALSDSFGFYLLQQHDSSLADDIRFAKIDSPAALCFVGFLKSKSSTTKARAEYVKRVLRQWLDDHVSSYFSLYPTDKLWIQALEQSKQEIASPE